MDVLIFGLLALVNLALIAVSTVIVPLSAMMFDAGETPLLWVKFSGMIAVPVVALIGLIGGLIVLFGFGLIGPALWWVGAPLIYLAVYAVFFIIFW